MKAEKKDYPKWHDLVAGAAAGAGARLVSAPFDLLKIRMQLQSQSSKFSGMFQSFTQIVREEGFRGLFKGNTAATYLWIGYAAVQFSLYARISSTIQGWEHDSSYNGLSSSHQANIFTSQVQSCTNYIATNPTAVAFISGASAGFIATLMTYPLDICRTTFAAQTNASGAEALHKSILGYASSTVRSNGFKGFFAGIGPALIQIIPYMGLNFAVYDYLVRMSKQHNVGDAGIAGAIAGGSSKMIVYPLDTVKRRLQAQTFVVGSSYSVPKYNSMMHCIRTVLKEEGPKSFYKGLVPSVCKNMVSTSFTFAFYTLSKSTLEVIHDKTTPSGKGDNKPLP